MAKKLSVLLVSHSSTRLNTIEDVLNDVDGLAPTRKLLTERQRDFGGDIRPETDVVVLDLGPNWEGTLGSLAGLGVGGSGLPLIVLGNRNEPDMMRRAMQAGARDFFVSPIDEEELIEAIRRVGVETQLSRRQHAGDITAMINGKGGSGATFLATSLGCLLAERDNEQDASCVLVDLDLQFGNLPVYLDLPSSDSLANALRASDTLDPMALDSLMQRHGSGVRILASQPDGLRTLGDVGPADVQALLGALARVSAHVLVDVPRTIDPVAVAALEMADKVLVPMQQTVPHVRDARYLMSLLRSLGLPNSRMELVINRFDPKGEVQLQDIEDTFPEIKVHSILNDYKKASYAVNHGVPVTEKWPRAPITKSLLRTANAVWVPVPKVGQHSRRRLFGR